MRQWIVVMLMALMPHLAWAQVPSEQDYLQAIHAHWPHVDLRVEQRRWLAQRSLQALQDCHRGGRELAWCQQLVREGLREMIGAEPLTSAAASNW